MKKKLRLRGYVVYTLIALLLGVIAYSGYEIYKIVQEDSTDMVTDNYVNKEIK